MNDTDQIGAQVGAALKELMREPVSLQEVTRAIRKYDSDIFKIVRCRAEADLARKLMREVGWLEEEA